MEVKIMLECNHSITVDGKSLDKKPKDDNPIVLMS